MKKLQTWKGGVVNKLTGGVRTLLKGNGVEVIDAVAHDAAEQVGGDLEHRPVVERSAR